MHLGFAIFPSPQEQDLKFQHCYAQWAKVETEKQRQVWMPSVDGLSSQKQLASKIQFYTCCALRASLLPSSLQKMKKNQNKKKRKKKEKHGGHKTKLSFTTQTCQLEEVSVPTDAKWKTCSFRGRSHSYVQGEDRPTKIICAAAVVLYYFFPVYSTEDQWETQL